jgi:beta-lactamase regulating signal transducer with metallopeptidase domain
VTVVHAMLGNAAVAAILALFALAIGYACRSPAVRHVAWVLVLLKLVTPPLFHVPLRILPASWADPPAESTSAASRLVQFPPSISDAHNSPTRSEVRAPTWWDRFRAGGAADWALAVWFAGAVGWFVWQCQRMVRFRRQVAGAEDAGPEVAAASRGVASALGIARPPSVKVATGIGSPMLWGWGRGSVILFPRALLARLAPEARDTLLAHELAHFLRRDHWVRVLEFVATGLYWWHPAVWLARAGIEAAEEECCDAWVVGGLAASPRRYAEALLATVDFLAELRRPVLPPAACAANRSARLLHRRLVGIIHAERPSRLRGAAVFCVLAAAALVVQPVLRAAIPEVTAPPSAPLVAKMPLPSSPSPRPPKVTEPHAWATAAAPGGALTAVARDNEVVLRRADGTVIVLGPGKPLALAFAPDGRRLATAGPGTRVRTWDDRGCLVVEAHVPAAARAVAYTPDGALLLVLDAAGGISVLDPQSLTTQTHWSVEGPANSIACAPDNRTVAVACGSWLDAETGWVEFWSIMEGRKLVTYTASAPVGATRFAPDGGMLVIGGWNGLSAWRTLPGGILVAERQLPKDMVAATAFSPDAGTLPLEPPPEVAPPPSPVPQTMPDLLGEVSRLLNR